uniref:Cleavage and polyadenylation specificity factor subunit 3 n=1 Tax=Panagrolaimus superbus TaxID=310955 RepID=A0A914Y1J2_9BILA
MVNDFAFPGASLDSGTEEPYGSVNSDVLQFIPLGSGQEVGRSCHFLNFKGKKILLDCGIHPGMHGIDSLPFLDYVDVDEIDLLLITHFHLDHCGALPWLLTKTAFRGRCFMTHASKAIYRILLGDFVKVAKNGPGGDRILYTEDDVEKSMSKIECIDFKEQKEVNGVRFRAYVAGHVLGACMFMIEIDTVRILYTGDFSCEEDRHLRAAEIPEVTPDILISESTYGTQSHESREVREQRFTDTVKEIVSRGGRCLIPVFALGRAQELLLILDEYWHAHPELHTIPILYASSLAKKCMSVYQTFVNGMNSKVQRNLINNNPFVFKHITYLKNSDHFDDVGPCVILASPGMLQPGLSRQLFEQWCPDSKNGCIVAGYCVEGTLAKHILSEPEEIVTLTGRRIPVRMQISYISFSAHTDFNQTSDFVTRLKPHHIILVHGEQGEMSRLRNGLQRLLEHNPDFANLEIHMPRNTEKLNLRFASEKVARLVGSIVTDLHTEDLIQGVLMRKNFNYNVLVPQDLMEYSSLRTSDVSSHQTIYFSRSEEWLAFNLRTLDPKLTIEQVEGYDLPDYLAIDPKRTKKELKKPATLFKMFDNIIAVHLIKDETLARISWTADVEADNFVDIVVFCIMNAQEHKGGDNKLLEFVESQVKEEKDDVVAEAMNTETVEAS